MSTLVRDYMATELETLAPDSTLQEATLLETVKHIRHIPILEGGELVGIVTDRDLKRAMPSLLSGIDRGEYERVMKETKVQQIMTRSPLTISPDAPLKEAIQIICDKKFGALPVADGTNLLGILTATDCLRAFLKVLENE